MFCLANCCRFCLSKDDTLVEYTCCSEDNISYVEKLTKIAPQLLTDTEIFYPTGICKMCQDKLNEAYSFLQDCFKSKDLLRTYIAKLMQTRINCSSVKSTNMTDAEENIFVEVPMYYSESISGHMENEPIKTEIDNEDVIALPEFVSCVVGPKSENPLLVTAESVSFDTCVKEEIFHSEYIPDQDLHNSDLFVTSIKYEHENVSTGDSNSNTFHEDQETDTEVSEEQESDTEEDNLESDTCTSPDEFEPIRKNEKTPRLKRYKCVKCVKKFSRYSHLLRHSRVHTGNRPFPCKTCNKSFSQLENLERHQLIHSDTKPHTCTECGKSFRDKSYFKKHIQLHEGKRYTCDVCGKAYTNSRNLIVHNRKHTGERPFECDICKNKYADPDTLRKHKKKCETKSVNSDGKCQENVQKNTVADKEQIAK